ncbi:MAG: MBOAT family protein [Lachnospiraceae bacterium]|nr:MBOAT family protein [Lachnospiraceae bacterium]
MLFNSYSFMLFFPIVLCIYFVIPKKARHVWLLVASYYFYMGWNAKYAILIAISTIVTYLGGLCIEKRKEKRKWIVAGVVLINLSILFFFKYFDFFLGNVNRILSLFGANSLQKGFDILLPVGISFYTFQALGYTIDVYRGTIKAEKNFLKYALFVSFFPQLVAGPIERSGNLLRQINRVEQIKLWNYRRITEGAVLMLWGYFLKMVIADRVSIVVDQVYDSYWMYGSVEIIIASVLFAIQIYCDFASYSQIAIGAAKIMGFELMENFNTPYFASSIRDFWRRWHISLSTWLRDYVYIPLGGSRCSKVRKYLNLLLTFLISGLWHGANWTYVVWGMIHGIYQIVEDATESVRDKLVLKLHIMTNNFSYRFGQILVTFVLTDFAWIFFRANYLSDACQMIGRIVTKWNPWVLFDGSVYNLGLNITEVHILLVALIVLFLVDLVRYKKQVTLDMFLSTQNLWFRFAVIFGLLFFILIYGEYGPGFSAKQFIYFQF